MCGICGIVSTDTALANADAVSRMAAVLHHRGPDDGGTWELRGGRDGVAFGHRRLSIIDLSHAGHQPMTNEDGSIWLSYNGEIYNHADVRRELEPRGHEYRSHTDTETILHAYEEWGDRCVERFRGMFAFALWDGPRRRLLLVRDRLGVKPVYYALVGSTLVFASEIKAILETGLVQPRPARGALSEYLLFGYRAGEDTMFEGVHRLLPGHLLVWEAGRVRTERYWSLRFEPDTRTPVEELKAEFRRLFEESVRLRLMADVPLGVFLSGGLDSSAIAVAMSRLVREPINTFSVGYESKYYSELSYAREVAKQVGASHHEVVLTAEAFLEALPRLVWYEDEPLWGTASVALYFVSKLASERVKVVLTGEGSDELFAGYDRYWMTALNAGPLRLYRTLPRAARRQIRQWLVTGGPLPERVRRGLGHTFIGHDSLPDGLFFDNWFGLFSPEWQRQLAGPRLVADLETTDPYDHHRRIFNDGPADGVVDQMLYSDIHTNLVELLMKQDQMSMATSIESRVPFLDHKLVEFAAKVPSSYKVKGFSGKHLVKEALAGYLPDSILHRKKMGFPVPYEEWLRERFWPDIERTLLSEAAADRGWFRVEAIRSLLDEHRTGRANHARQIWTLWGLELWAGIFLDGQRPPGVASASSPNLGAFRGRPLIGKGLFRKAVAADTSI